VNAWIAEVNKGARGRGAPEFWLFSPEIAAWAPADSIAILKLMALQLSGRCSAEVLRARLSLVLEPGRLADILPEDPRPRSPPCPIMPRWCPAPPRARPRCSLRWARCRRWQIRPWPVPRTPGPRGPARSAAGGALLANDPHLGLTAPSIWYLARLELPSGG
jgi:penicillin amidase